MFWLLIIAPFVLLIAAAMLSKKASITKISIFVAVLFAMLDGYALWDVTTGDRSSTGGLGLAALGIIEIGFSLVVLVGSLLSRRARATTS